MNKVTLELTIEEAKTVEKALRALRDRHYGNYYRASNQDSDSAQKQLAIYEELEELRMIVNVKTNYAVSDYLRAVDSFITV